MKASAVRALFAVANRPSVVSLAGGMPNIQDLPLGKITDSLAEMIAKIGPQAMQYGSGQGEPRLREQICEVMSLEGISAHPDDVTVTVGSQQGLDLITRIFCNPGDVVLAEAPSYVGALSTFLAYQTEVIHIPVDENGIIPSLLVEAVEKCRKQGKSPKFLYTIPNFSNPTGITQDIARRKELLETCERLGILIVEDNPYGLLNFEATPVPAIRSLNSNQVIYLGSFSKTYAPGFRIGWVLAPHAVREKIVLAQEAATLCPPTFGQFAISNYLENFDWQAQITDFKVMYRHRRDAMLEALSEYMPPETTWTNPDGGFFCWLTLPNGLDSEDMLPRAVSSRVAYTPGTAFYADGRGGQNMRLSFCYPPAERIREGVRRLAEVINRELEVIQTFGVESSSTHKGLGSGPATDQI